MEEIGYSSIGEERYTIEWLLEAALISSVLPLINYLDLFYSVKYHFLKSANRPSQGINKCKLRPLSWHV